MKKLCAYVLSGALLCSSFSAVAKDVQGAEYDDAIFNVKSGN